MPGFRFSVSPRRRLAVAALCAALGGCAVGPDYQRPAIDVGAAYKEAAAPQPGWTPAQPSDESARGQWWQVYGDPVLDGLVQQLNQGNYSVAQAEANYRQAQALVRNARAGFFPTIGAGADVTRSGSGGGSGAGSNGSSVGNQYSLSGSVSWDGPLGPGAGTSVRERKGGHAGHSRHRGEHAATIAVHACLPGLLSLWNLACAHHAQRRIDEDRLP
ncbi:outer membrane efflux domain protein, partial [Bordetella bronchiseptica 980-2]